MGWKDKAKAAGTAAGIVVNMATAPVQNTGNIADSKREGKAMMRDRANNDASRMRGETRAKASVTAGAATSNQASRDRCSGRGSSPRTPISPAEGRTR